MEVPEQMRPALQVQQGPEPTFAERVRRGAAVPMQLL